MLIDGIKAIREITDYWMHLNTINRTNMEKSMKSALDFGRQKHIGFDYSKRYRAGDFCWIEYGNNLEPELSFEHIGLIFMKKGHMYYTLPLTTPKPSNRLHMNAYHAVDNPSGNNEYVLIKKIDFPFLDHDSLIKTSEIKIVSIKRIKSILGRTPIENPLIKDVIRIAHKCTFTDYDYEINQLRKENSRLKMQLFLSSIKEQYVAKNFVDFSNQLLIPQQYEVGVNDPKKISLKTYEYKLELIDEYGQREAKTITYIIEE